MGAPSVQRFCIPHCEVSGRKSAPVITRCNCRSLARESILSGGRSELLVSEFVGFERFIVNFVEGRNAVIPFQQGRGATHLLDCVRVHLPDRVEHWMIVGIEQVFFELRMARDMDLPHAMVRDVV